MGHSGGELSWTEVRKEDQGRYFESSKKNAIGGTSYSCFLSTSTRAISESTPDFTFMGVPLQERPNIIAHFPLGTGQEDFDKIQNTKYKKLKN